MPVLDLRAGVWTPEKCQPLSARLVPLAEEIRLYYRRKSLEPLRLDAATASKILSDAQWPQPARECLKEGSSPILAIIFNWLGVPDGSDKYAVFAVGMAAILKHESATTQRIEELVREFKDREAGTKPAEKKTGSLP